MQIKEIYLTNFRSYRDSVQINDFSKVNTFIGPNTAGKSNIFEAMRYLKALAGIGEGLRGFGELVFDRNPNLEMHIDVIFSLSSTERTEIIKTLFKPVFKFEEVEKSPFLSDIICSFAIKNNGVVGEEIRVKNMVEGDLPLIKNHIEGEVQRLQSIDLDKKCTELERAENIPATGFVDRGTFATEFRILRVEGLSKTELNLVNKLREFMSRWIWFPPVRQAPSRTPLGEETMLLPSGANLAKFLNTLQSNTPRRFVSLGDEVIRVLPIVQEILAPTKGAEATVAMMEDGLSTPTDLGNVSFGFMQILILVYGIVTANAGSVILIEEPELHLHAGSQRRLFELILKEAVGNNKQVFLTTHSTIFTGCNEIVKTYLVNKQIQETSELRLIKTELGHRNTDLYGDECVAFIEGDSEEVAFPIIADALGYNLVEKGIRLINLKGSGKAKKIEEYLRYLKDSGVLAYVIADGDKEVSKKLEDWKREGLLREGCATVWPLEFEDCFDLEILARAIAELSKEQKWNLPLTIEELKIRKEEGKSVVKLIQRLIHEKDLPSLDKPALAEKIAHLLKQDIRTNKQHKKTLPEMEIEKIVNLVKR